MSFSMKCIVDNINIKVEISYISFGYGVGKLDSVMNRVKMINNLIEFSVRMAPYEKISSKSDTSTLTHGFPSHALQFVEN